eukprot:jgi/Tetstr1/424155/TSEL_014761.t1
MYGNPFGMLGGSEDDDGSSGGTASESGSSDAGDGRVHFVPATDADDAAPHRFATEDVGDHAETPAEAYAHIAPLLRRLATRLRLAPAELRIYDPYFCEGRVRTLLGDLGFTNVYNKNEDFYAAAAARACPDFDVLVTNPPFSGDNIDRCFRFAVRSGKPWFMLIPQYCAKKAFFLEWLHNRRDACRPAFLGPTTAAYVFTAPNRADVRAAREQDPEPDTEDCADAGGRGEPATAAAAAPEGFDVRAGSFQCVWFFSMGNKHQKPVLEWWRRAAQGQPSDDSPGREPPEYTIASDVKELPQLMAVKKATPAERRRKKKMAQQRTAQGEGGHADSQDASCAAGGEGSGGLVDALSKLSV